MPKSSGRAELEKLWHWKRTPLWPDVTKNFKPIWTRGPVGLQHSLAARFERYPFPPGWWRGSLPEWILFWAHTKIGLEHGVDFTYQAPFEGGRIQFGGLVLDFLENTVPIAINVNGKFWHYFRGIRGIMRDQQARYALAGYGYRLVFIDDDQLLRGDPVAILKEALLGIDRSVLGVGR